MFQSPNILKTVYCHFSQNPSVAPIQIDSNIWISGVNISHGHKYLGMKFIPTNNFEEIIKFNLNDRKGKICKFYAWLENNYDTPIEIKLLVLDNCLFSSLLYGIETRGNISCIEKDLRTIEIKALKSILNVKKGTSNDLIYKKGTSNDLIYKKGYK